jgi:hypothetical protein
MQLGGHTTILSKKHRRYEKTICKIGKIVLPLQLIKCLIHPIVTHYEKNYLSISGYAAGQCADGTGL